MVDGRRAEQGAVEVEASHPWAIRPLASIGHLSCPSLDGSDLDRAIEPVRETTLLRQNQSMDGAEKIIERTCQVGISLNCEHVQLLVDSVGGVGKGGLGGIR